MHLALSTSNRPFVLPSTRSLQDVLSSTASQVYVSSSPSPTSLMVSFRYTSSLLISYFSLALISVLFLYHLTFALARDTWHSRWPRCLYMAILSLSFFTNLTGSSIATTVLDQREYRYVPQGRPTSLSNSNLWHGALSPRGLKQLLGRLWPLKNLSDCKQPDSKKQDK